MNWEAIGAIAELLGAIGVIASLVYLAAQIRHGQEQIRHGQEQMERNTQALRASNYQVLNQDFHQRFGAVISVPGFSEITRQGLTGGFDQLGDEDAFRFSFWVTGVMEAFDSFVYQHRVGMVDDDRWQKHHIDLVRFLNTPGVKEWWLSDQATERGGHANFSPELVALATQILGEEPDRQSYE